MGLISNLVREKARPGMRHTLQRSQAVLYELIRQLPCCGTAGKEANGTVDHLSTGQQ